MSQVPPSWPPPAAPVFRASSNQTAMVIGVVLAVAMVVVFGFIFFATGAPVGFFFPFCGVTVFIIVLILVAVLSQAGGFGGSRLPPPPPIQQPMVPAGVQGPVALSCPNCGAPPQNVDRFGVATCTYCGTRFLVR